MKTSIMDQFAADAINAPETVTGGHGGGRTHRRTRRHHTRSGGNSVMRRTRTRTRRHHTRRG